MLARGDFAMFGSIAIVEMRVCHFQGQLAAIGHGIARIDGEVENGIFQLVRIGQGVPQAARDDGFDLDLFTEGPAEHLAQIADDASQIDGTGRQRLTAGKSQQLAREARPARHRANCILQPLAQLGISLGFRLATARSRLALTICSRLLKSCATPPVKWPMASIFCDCRTIVSARTRAVTSITPMTKPPVATGAL